MAFIEQKDLWEIQKKLEQFDMHRERIINASRDITRDAKHAIICLHRNDTPSAIKVLKSAEQHLAALWKLEQGTLEAVGAYHACVQEYVEARCLFQFVVEKKLFPYRKFKRISEEDYLLGVCDLTGELARRAVLLAIEKQTQNVKELWMFLREIHDFFLSLHLRNGELRKKYDAMKWNLKKVEEVVYDLEMKKQ